MFRSPDLRCLDSSGLLISGVSILDSYSRCPNFSFSSILRSRAMAGDPGDRRASRPPSPPGSSHLIPSGPRPRALFAWLGRGHPRLAKLSEVLWHRPGPPPKPGFGLVGWRHSCLCTLRLMDRRRPRLRPVDSVFRSLNLPITGLPDLCHPPPYTPSRIQKDLRDSTPEIPDSTPEVPPKISGICV